MSRDWTGRQELRYVCLPADNVDTDQIIPARFLTTTERDGLGDALFADRRTASAGGFDLDGPEAAGAAALVVGANFGCGSSREHAVWALQQGGFDVVLGASLADIFRRNALENGLLAIEISSGLWRQLIEKRVDSILIDLEQHTVGAGSHRETFEIDPFARYCMLRQLDALTFLLGHEEEIAAYEQQRHDERGGGR